MTDYRLTDKFYELIEKYILLWDHNLAFPKSSKYLSNNGDEEHRT